MSLIILKIIYCYLENIKQILKVVDNKVLLSYARLIYCDAIKKQNVVQT